MKEEDFREALKKLQHTMDRVLKTKDFVILGGFSERHGAWETTYYRKKRFSRGLEEDELNRYIVLAVLSFPPLPDTVSYRVELWVGADDGTRFVRRLESQFAIGEAEFKAINVSEQIGPWLKHALKAAKEIRSSELTEFYPAWRSTHETPAESA